MGLITDAIEHALRRGLESVYQLAFRAGCSLVDGDLDTTRVHLARAIAAADERARALIQETLQLLEAVGEDERREATDRDVAQSVGGVDA